MNIKISIDYNVVVILFNSDFSNINFIRKPSFYLCYLSFSVLPKLKPFDTDNEPLMMDEFFQVLCTAIHGDHPMQFSWLLGNQTVYPSERIRIDFTKRSSTLSIESVSGDDAGNYTCVASNRAGATESVVELVVKGS